jgi:hypothetical protein
MSVQHAFEPGLAATHREVQAPELDPLSLPEPKVQDPPKTLCVGGAGGFSCVLDRLADPHHGSRTTVGQVQGLRNRLLTLLKGRTLGMSVAMIRAHIADFLKFEQVCGRIQAYHMSEDDIRTIDILFPDDVAYFTISLKFSEII